MENNTEPMVFDEILSPLLPLIKKASKNIKGDAEKYSLSFYCFTMNIVFGIILGTKSISLLITEIKTSSEAKAFGLRTATKSMYSEAFRRYDPEIYRIIVVQLLAMLNLTGIPEIQSLGRILLVDGSLFPAMSTMRWASYKKNFNAVKLQLAFELNRMTPVEFFSGEGNFSERKFLRQIIEKGVTYICDRGYICFNLFKEIGRKGAFFIIRGKSNMGYNVIEHLAVNIPAKFSCFLNEVKDFKIQFKNDENEKTYRIITFSSIGDSYILITNRFDLSTYQVIMLYAYRWQVELFFRVIKRTFKGIHLMAQNPKGVEIQFYLYIIVYILLLSFKQKCEFKNEKIKLEEQDNQMNAISVSSIETPESIKNKEVRQYVCGLVSLLGEKLKKFWKISIHWLTAVRNLLKEPFTNITVKNIVLIQ